MPTVVLSGSNWRTYGSDATSFQSTVMTAGTNSLDVIRRSYITFDLSSIPNGSTVNSASINIVVDSANINYTTQLYKLESSPSYNPTLGTLIREYDSNDPLDGSVLGTVREWIEDGDTNYGFFIKYRTEGDNDEFTTYHSPTSPQGPNRPTLTINYTEPPYIPGAIKVNGVWKTSEDMYVKKSGTWKKVTDAKIKVGGIWKDTI